MANDVDFEDIVLYLIENAPGELSITQLTKLAYLADIEHQQLYGVPLSNVRWRYHHYGPFTQGIYSATNSLLEREQIVRVDRPASDEMGKAFSAVERRDRAEERLSSKALRVLATVLARWGHLSVPQMKQVAYGTVTMRSATPGDLLDLSGEPRRVLGSNIPGLASFLQRAPAPVVRDKGDPSASAEEDRQILRELGDLRRAANRELV